jgi:hypothetical protein
MISNLIEIFLISVLPISLVKFKIISSKFRLVMLAIVCFLLCALIYFQNISFANLGIRLDNFYSGMVIYYVTMILGILFLIILSEIMHTKSVEKWYKDPHFLFLFIPISFAQQFLFQGFILFKLNSVFNPFIAIIITALIFGYMHTIYPKPLFNMILGTIAGLLFATLFTIHPNIFLSSITHAVLNFTAVYLGFFTFLDSDNKPQKTELNFN